MDSLRSTDFCLCFSIQLHPICRELLPKKISDWISNVWSALERECSMRLIFTAFRIQGLLLLQFISSFRFIELLFCEFSKINEVLSWNLLVKVSLLAISTTDRFSECVQLLKIEQFLFAADRDTKLNNIARFIIYKTSIQSIYCPSSSLGIAILTFNGFCIRPFSFIVIPFIVVLLQFVEVYKFRAT